MKDQQAFVRSFRLSGDPPAVRLELELTGRVDLNELKGFLGHWARLTLEEEQLKLPFDDQLIVVNRETGEVIE